VAQFQSSYGRLTNNQHSVASSATLQTKRANELLLINQLKTLAIYNVLWSLVCIQSSHSRVINLTACHKLARPCTLSAHDSVQSRRTLSQGASAHDDKLTNQTHDSLSLSRQCDHVAWSLLSPSIIEPSITRVLTLNPPRLFSFVLSLWATFKYRWTLQHH